MLPRTTTTSTTQRRPPPPRPADRDSPPPPPAVNGRGGGGDSDARAIGPRAARARAHTNASVLRCACAAATHRRPRRRPEGRAARRRRRARAARRASRRGRTRSPRGAGGPRAGAVPEEKYARPARGGGPEWPPPRRPNTVPRRALSEFEWRAIGEVWIVGIRTAARVSPPHTPRSRGRAPRAARGARRRRRGIAPQAPLRLLREAAEEDAERSDEKNGPPERNEHACVELKIVDEWRVRSTSGLRPARVHACRGVRLVVKAGSWVDLLVTGRLVMCDAARR